MFVEKFFEKIKKMENFNQTKYTQEQKRVANELLNTEIEVIWEDEGGRLKISIPFEDTDGTIHETALIGHIEKLENDKVAATEDDTFFYLDNIHVNPMARGREIGLLLLEELCVELEKKGVTHIFGVARDENAMALFAKAFGRDNLVFYKSNYKPIEIDEVEGLVDRYLRSCQYIDFGVDISRLEEEKSPKLVKPIKFIRKKTNMINE